MHAHYAHMARARRLMPRWRGRGIQYRCCKSCELHAHGCCNKSAACKPSDHHLHVRQIGTGWSLDLLKISMLLRNNYDDYNHPVI